LTSAAAAGSRAASSSPRCAPASPRTGSSSWTSRRRRGGTAPTAVPRPRPCPWASRPSRTGSIFL